MPIPPGTKFHGVAPGVETENKGSASRNANRDAYTIEDFGGSSVFEYKGDIPATATLTFTGDPSPGDTITIGSVTATYTSGNPTIPNGIRIGGGGSTQNNTERFFNDGPNSSFVTPTDISPVFAIRDSSNNSQFIAVEGGPSGNSIAVSTTSPALSWSSLTLQGGAEGTPSVIDNSANIYIKCIASRIITHGAFVYQVGLDPDTNLPYVNSTVTSAKGVVAKTNNAYVPLGMAVHPDGGTSRFEFGEEVTVCVFGVVGDVLMYSDPITGLRPNAGETLSLVADNNSLQRSNGKGLPIATVLYKGTDGTFARDAIVFINSPIATPFTRPNIDGVFNQNTTRISGYAASGTIDGGSLLVYDSFFGITDTPKAKYRLYTSSDAESDIVGISSASTTGTGPEDSIGICTNGLVSEVPLYDAAGALIGTTGLPTGPTPIGGNVVYAGDGTINPSHVLTTDPTSGVAVGIVITTAFQTVVPSNRWTILFQPSRVGSGSSAVTRLIPFFQEATPGGSGTYTENNNIVDFNWVGGPGTYEFTLPSATTIPYRTIRFVNDGTVTANDKVHIVAPTGETIDGATFYEINKVYNGIAVWSDGVNWIVIQAKST